MSSPLWVRRRACQTKKPYTRDQAQRRAIARELTAYRCPFACEHEDQRFAWHVGHAPTMRSLEAIAILIRERQGYDLRKKRSA